MYSDLGEELNCLCWDGRTVLIGGGSGNVNIWDLHSGIHKKSFSAHKGPVTALAVSSSPVSEDGGQYVVTGGDDRKVLVWSNICNK